ncbi:MAG: helix-turn-helix transcriptional regulator [Gemmatimonadaceae bacterium]
MDKADVADAYTIVAPEGRLADYVRAIWTVNAAPSPAGSSEQPVVPDGCPELIFNLGDPIHRLRGSEVDVHDRTMLAGQITGAIQLRPQGRVTLIGVRLHPWAMHALLGVGAVELRDNIVPLEMAVGGALRERLDDFSPDAGPSAFAGAVTEALWRHVAGRPAPSAAAITVYRALRHVPRDGSRATVRGVAKSLGRSERQLQRVFEESVGLSPKLYLRMLRVQRALRFAEREPARSWGEVSAWCGFYDQSHLTREFLQFAGCTPSMFDEGAGILTRSLLS